MSVQAPCVMRLFPMGFLLALRLFYHCALAFYKTVNNQTYAQKDERDAEKLTHIECH